MNKKTVFTYPKQIMKIFYLQHQHLVPSIARKKFHSSQRERKKHTTLVETTRYSQANQWRENGHWSKKRNPPPPRCLPPKVSWEKFLEKTRASRLPPRQKGSLRVSRKRKFREKSRCSMFPIFFPLQIVIFFI